MKEKLLNTLLIVIISIMSFIFGYIPVISWLFLIISLIVIAIFRNKPMAIRLLKWLISFWLLGYLTSCGVMVNSYNKTKEKIDNSIKEIDKSIQQLDNVLNNNQYSNEYDYNIQEQQAENVINLNFDGEIIKVSLVNSNNEIKSLFKISKDYSDLIEDKNEFYIESKKKCKEQGLNTIMSCSCFWTDFYKIYKLDIVAIEKFNKPLIKDEKQVEKLKKDIIKNCKKY